jgi:hypothetical protein
VNVPDRFDCYEACVQSPRHVVAFLRGLYLGAHGDDPVSLGEDFAGTAAVARRWCRDLSDIRGRARCADLDPETLACARARIASDGLAHAIELVHEDCLTSAAIEPCDMLFVGNFSIGYARARPDLLRYLTRARERLARARHGFGGGIFVCDTYGGPGAFRIGGIERTHPSARGDAIRYAWRHEAADPRTALVHNSISFRVERNGEVIAELPHAFEYHWRLWSLPELRDALLDAGFTRVAVHTDVNIAPGQVPREADAADFPDDWTALVVAYT